MNRKTAILKFLEERQTLTSIALNVIKQIKNLTKEFLIFVPDVPFSFSRQGKKYKGFYAFGPKHILRFEAYDSDPKTLVSIAVWETGDSLSESPDYIVHVQDDFADSEAIAKSLVGSYAPQQLGENIKIYREAAKDETVAEFLNEVGYHGETISTLYRKYLKWTDAKDVKPISDAAFYSKLKAYKDNQKSTPREEPSSKITIEKGIKDDAPAPEPEYDEFEQELLNNSVLYKYSMIAEIVKKIVTWDPLYRNAFIYGVGGVGKEQPHSAKILLPDGTWTTMGAIKAGDRVKTPSGRVATVLQKFPQGVKPVFKLTLQDGSTTRAGAEHLWKCKRDSDRKAVIKTTAQLYETLNANKTRFDSREIKSAETWYLPMVEPLDYDAPGLLPIDPYYLGVLLGDGRMTNGLTFTTADAELKSALEAYLADAFDIQFRQMKDDPITWRLVSAASRDGYSPIGSNKLIVALKQLGLYGKRDEFKFIPEVYKRASAADRFSLIQGLVDTDGWMSPSLCFDSTSKQLAEDFVYLVRSLGGRAHMSSHMPTCMHKGKRVSGKCAYNVVANLPIDMGTPCRLTRKKEIYEASRRQNHRWQPIVAIELDGQEECSCIMLDDPEHLYITDDFIVTHNTHTVMQVVDEYADKDRVISYTGAVSGFTGLLQILWENREGKIIIFDDNDAMLENVNALNLLKGAMENRDPRILSYVRFKRTSAPVKAESADLVIDVSKLHENLVSIWQDGEKIAEEVITPREARWYERISGSFVTSRPHLYEDDDYEENAASLDPEIDPAYGMDASGGVPDRFQFTSRIIFISNLMKVPQPLMDRCISIGLLLTKQQILDLIDSKLEHLMTDAPEVSLEEKKKVLAFMQKYIHRIGKPLTFRLFQQLVAIYHSGHPDALKMMYLTMMGEGLQSKLR